MFSALVLWIMALLMLVSSSGASVRGQEPTTLRIIADWRGDYPVSELRRLPAEQQSTSSGYLGDAQSFAGVWNAFKPGEDVPVVDFNQQLVLFARNLRFFNRVGIAKVLVTEGVANVLVMETMSALPIEDKIGMALAVVPRQGVEFIDTGNLQIPVPPGVSSLNEAPLNTTYIIEGSQVALRDGCYEGTVVPDSATKTRTQVSGAPTYGDLDGDGDEDAALLLTHDPGGSGTFTYVAAALNVDGHYQGTHAVLVGDRIIPLELEVKGSHIFVRYLDRGFKEPMSAEPTVDRSVSMSLKNGQLEMLKPLSATEQIVPGWVTMGHEVRRFQPCNSPDEHWLSGTSPALAEIAAEYKRARRVARPYTPLFMVLAGRSVKPPADGFGADYPAAFDASQIVSVRAAGSCQSENIVVAAPLPGESIRSPLKIRGRARGSWFFEGDFPVALQDRAGTVIASGFVAATDEWMTKEFVPFEGTLEFKKPSGVDSGFLVFKKDNPSDCKKLDAEMGFLVFLQ